MAETRHTTSIALSVLDQATQTLRRVQSEFARTRHAADRAGSGARSALGGAARFGLGVFSSAARVALGAATALARGGLGLIADAGMAALSVTKRMAAATLALGLAITLTTAQVTRSSVELAANRQAQEQGLQNILGSADAAAFAIERLKAIGRLPGISFDQAIQGFSALSSVNVDFDLALGLIGEFGNAVALSGGSVEELSFALRGLSQMFGRGKVSAEELNQQILEQAPIIRRAIQAAWGTADTELITKRLEKQKLTITDFWARTLEEMRKLPRAGDGAKNALENLVISWNEMRIAAGRGFMTGGFAGQLAALTEWVERMTPTAERLGVAFRQTFDQGLARLPDLVAMVRELASGDFLGLARRTDEPLLFKALLGLEKAKPLAQQVFSELLAGDWQALGERLTGAFRFAWEAARPVVAQIGREIWDTLNDAIFGSSGKGKPLLDPKLWDQVKEVFTAWREAFMQIAPEVFGLLKEVFAALPSFIPAIKALAEAVASVDWKTLAAGVAMLVKSLGEWTATHPDLAGLLLGGGMLNKLLGGAPGQIAGSILSGLGSIGGGAGWGLLLPLLLSGGALTSALFTRPKPMAAGGVVTRPTFAMLGERGPEAVVPLSGGGLRVMVSLDDPTRAVLDPYSQRRLEYHLGQFFREMGSRPDRY